ncbi:MAG: hypothetical protein KAT26_03170, partial [Marinosulfonomonas sp.]|nr:hypothetical protein [Marinosulfonomonas sp.]
MRFFRSGIKALLRQPHEKLIGGAILLVGVSIGAVYFGTILHWPAILIGAFGLFVMKKGKRLARYQGVYDAPKVVETTERRNIYFGPEGDDSFSLNDVVKIEIETTGDGPFDEDLYWIFYLSGDAPVRMAGPVAMGHGIFDVLDGFVGADMEKVIESASVVDPA